MNAVASVLPQTEGGWFLTDGGLETDLIYHEGIALPEFAAFVLLDSPAGRETLARYYRRYLDIAAATPGAGFVLESPTWRAGLDWCRTLGLDEAAMRRLNAEGVALMQRLRDAHAGAISGPIVVSGCIGPRGDGYRPGQAMSGDDAMRAHAPQARALAEAGVDMITAMTMTTCGEAIGVARAAAAFARPCGCPAARRWPRRSPRPTARPARRRPTTWSTARTRRTSRRCSVPMPVGLAPGSGASAACAPTPRAAAMPNSMP